VDKGRSARTVFLENFFSLSVLQFVTNALPIITVPYLTRTLGLEGFGIYVFIQALVSFLDVIVSYGFRVSATDQVAKNIENISAVSRIFWTVLFAKMWLLILSLTALFLGIGLFSTLLQNWILILCGLPLLLGNLMFPVWLFQGLQDMKFITILHSLAKVFFVATIFIYVHDPSHIWRALLLHASGFLIAGILSLLIAVRRFELRYYVPKPREILMQLKSGREIFLSQLMVSFYTTLNTIGLGFFQPAPVVAAYALGDKVYRLIGSLSAPFNRAIFPVLSTRVTARRQDYDAISRKSILGLFFVFSILGGVVYLFTPLIMFVLSGESNNRMEAEAVLQILAAAIPFFVIAASSTYHLVAQGKSGQLLKILFYSASLNVAFLAPISKFYGASGVAYLTLGVAIFIAVAQVRAMGVSLIKARVL